MSILLLLLINSVNPGFDFLRVSNAAPQIDQINGIWNNPAQLILPGRFVGFNYTSWLLDEGIYSIYLKDGNWGARFRYFNMGSVEYQSDRPEDDLMLQFSPYAAEIGLNRAFRIDKETSFGIGISGFFSRLYQSTARGYALSAGLMYMPSKLPGASVSAYIKNFGFKKTYLGYPINVPTEIGVMAEYRIKDRAVVGYRWLNNSTFKSDSLPHDVVSSHTIYGKLFLGAVELSASYSIGQTVVPLMVGLSYSVKDRFRFFYIYRHGFYGFNSPFITGIQMEF